MRPSTRLTQEFVAADVRRLKSSVTGGPPSEEEIQSLLTSAATSEGIDPPLRGDLDWIVMKAWRKTARGATRRPTAWRWTSRHLNWSPWSPAQPSL